MYIKQKYILINIDDHVLFEYFFISSSTYTSSIVMNIFATVDLESFFDPPMVVQQ